MARWVLSAVAIQRVSEVVWAKRNERRLRGRGGVEHGGGHYPAMVALHGAWLVATALESSATPRIRPGVLAGYALLQPLRYWVIRSLGDRWTTRIFVVPNEESVRRGPYRFVRHPNYAVVVAEIALLPVSLGAPRTATCFTVLNALLMAVRIPAEERALASAEPR
jgi:methyltransferase